MSPHHGSATGLDAALSGRTAVITGAAQGIGRSIALRFGKAGAQLVLADRDAEMLERTAEALGSQGIEVLPVVCDIIDVAQIDDMFRATIDRYEQVDVLVNNAAHARFGYLLDVSEEDWDYTLGVALRGNFFCAQRAARLMVPNARGKIINMSSMIVRLAHTRTGVYAMAKAGIEAMTRHFAVELAEYGIQVNAIAPGSVETELSRTALSEQGRQGRVARIPAGRMGAPEDVTGAALLLASSESDWMTGAVVAVDGGYTISGVLERRSDVAGT